MFSRETREASGAMFTIGMVFIVLLIIGTVAFVALNPVLVKFRTDTNRASQGYVESHQSLLLKLVSDYDDLDAKIAALGTSDADQQTRTALEGQQKAIVKRIRAEADLLQPADVPQSVRDFLRDHPR